MKKKKNLYNLRTENDEYYAIHMLRELIESKSFYSILNYVLWSWNENPNLKKKDILNVITKQQIEKQGKNNENIIYLHNSTKLN
jgi:hypothetical protein